MTERGVELDITHCDGQLVARFDLADENDRPCIRAKVSYAYETAEGAELEVADAPPFIQIGPNCFALSESTPGTGKWHIECPVCETLDLQITEPPLRELLRAMLRGRRAGDPRRLAVEAGRVEYLLGQFS